MYPERELIRLAARKVALRRDIAFRRAQCAGAAARAAHPLVLLDRVLPLWRRLSALAQSGGLPLGVLLARTFLPRAKILRSLLQWGPLVFDAARRVREAVASARAEPYPSRR